MYRGILTRMIEVKQEIPVKWIEKQINHSTGMEHAMWKKLLRRWENEQMRKYVKGLDNDNK